MKGKHMDDYWKQLRWIANRRAWVAISGDIKIIVSENTYDQHLKAHFARLGVGRQTWYKIMQDAHDEWQRQRDITAQLETDLDYWQNLKEPGIQLISLVQLSKK